MRVSRYAVGLWLALLLVCGAGAARPDDLIIIGSVVALRGDVFRDDGGRREPLAAKALLHPSDVIVVAAGKAKIGLNDGTIISIGENSRLQIAQYQSVANGLKTRLDLKSGVLRVFVNRSTIGGQFEVESEIAVAAVRGTDWLVEAMPDRTSVALLQGSVAVASRGASAAPVLLAQPGQGTDVRRGEPPTPVATWGAERLAATIARASFD